ncbi:MAG TPA: MarR family transcriptional regulator [Propionibacteriaceae bacterium]|nr:MarR family transcriptional regulator [Propionibacteriaceae bacterium]
MTTDELTRPERVAIARLQAMLELLPTALDRELAPAGLTAFEYTLLEALAEAPDHRLRLSTLAARTNASLPRLSRVVTGLERKGLAERTPCPSDARATNAVLTPEGLATFERTRPRHAAAVRTMVLDALGPDDVDDLARLMLAVLTRLDPAGRLTVTADAACPADPPTCPADPPACPADPAA